MVASCLFVALSSLSPSTVEGFTTLPLHAYSSSSRLPPPSTASSNGDREQGYGFSHRDLTRRFIASPSTSSPDGTGNSNNNPPSAVSGPRRRSQLQAVAEATTLEKPLSRRSTAASNSSVLKPKKKKGRRASSNTKETSFVRSMLLEHHLLTKEDEQELGRSLKKAQKIQDALKAIGQAQSEPEPPAAPRPKRGRPKVGRKAVIPANLNLHRANAGVFGSHGNERIDADPDVEDYDDLQNMSVYGVEQLEAKPKVNWDYELMVSTEDEGEDYHDADEQLSLHGLQNVYYPDIATSNGASSFIPTLPDTRRAENHNGSKRNHRAKLQQERNQVAELLQTISDADISRYFGLDGGRLELQGILMQGALARDTLIRSNIRLVVSIAKKWCKQQAPRRQSDTTQMGIYGGGWDRPSLDECIQEGIMGLSKAADRFEPSRNLRFATYATFWVTSYIRQCFQTAATTGFRVPSGYHDTRSNFKALVKSYYDQGEEVPPLAELASEMNLSEDRLEFILQTTKGLLSTDAPVYSNSAMMPGKAGNDDAAEILIGDTLMDDGPSPAEQVELSFLRQSLENAMASELVPYERDILRLRLGLDDGVARTVPQIVEEYGGELTMNDIRAAETRAYKKLRSPSTLSTYKLLAYLDFAGIDRAEAFAR